MLIVATETSEEQSVHKRKSSLSYFWPTNSLSQPSDGCLVNESSGHLVVSFVPTRRWRSLNSDLIDLAGNGLVTRLGQWPEFFPDEKTNGRVRRAGARRRGRARSCSGVFFFFWGGGGGGGRRKLTMSK